MFSKLFLIIISNNIDVSLFHGIGDKRADLLTAGKWVPLPKDSYNSRHNRVGAHGCSSRMIGVVYGKLTNKTTSLSWSWFMPKIWLSNGTHQQRNSLPSHVFFSEILTPLNGAWKSITLAPHIVDHYAQLLIFAVRNVTVLGFNSYFSPDKAESFW